MDPLYTPGSTNAAGEASYTFSFEPNGSSAPLKVVGRFIAGITYKTGSIYLVAFQSTFQGIIGVQATLMNTASGAGQSFKIDVDQDNTVLSPASGGAVLALAAVNTTTGARGDIAADAKCRVFVQLKVTLNGDLTPSAAP